MSFIKGIAASSGLAVAKAYRLVEPNLTFKQSNIEDVEKEIARFHSALKTTEAELREIRVQTEKELGADKANIFDAHLLVISDPELINPIEDQIKSNKMNAEQALKDTAQMFISMFEQMDNDYMKERAADIRDVMKRILSHLLGVKIPNPSMIAEEVIIVAEDLTPSDTAQLNRQYVKGFTTDIGGRTSHSAIMARSMDIPAVVGTKVATKEINDGDLIIIDGLSGEVHINPTPELVKLYEHKIAHYEEQKTGWTKLINEKTVTADGHRVELAANIGSLADLEDAVNNGAEGIGLYRTEFLYMGRDHLPSEEEQYEAYKAVLEGMGENPVIVRTLDIGGDKELPYLQLPKELNPFLGFRAIRLCLEQQHLFRTQLRALLRASVFGNLKVMFPMIATLQEFREGKAIFLEEKEKLLHENIKIAENIELGIMVEIPSTAIQADQFAKEVDFFSIGTNDLIQYTMAADRMNERVSYLYQPFNPAILRLIKMVIDAAHKEGKWTGMCGEMAGEEKAIPLLLGMGLDEFSMSANSILKIRSQISQLNYADLVQLSEKALYMGTAAEVIETIVRKLKL
ncbi:phosphoenolpyruvate--protein phosphotransferase [Bacillus aquiflavi]|uniref:Phosphoenolpyruvate-protein phosphotransferase n=1 Tax=Bacillus aquiflavi TaxID=2672567 RepID=A0A6B3VZG4_9BACI|nr:phosphoenolpyruvate--protein phosphotransferase [Bacillus aquiflavi]MBA4537391.1 phosphoenolpyruvate--protein phosphotransferase [Bacillus aquiflavi]NEY81647.1 phosphoenolpyruvate--protein phosphotransferase [Bacillus aquiflavi]UAC49208.1 phosphoenolpyruvate--protein phosphotransferase [Bacillus aquiflavi]